jgi:molecular chaperone DnaK (HSP70)
MGGVLGIDFGTAHTRCVLGSTVREPVPKEIVIPSALVLVAEGIWLGDDAVQQARVYPEGYVSGFKRMLGRLPSDPVCTALASRMGATLSQVGSQITIQASNGTVVGVDDAATTLLRDVADRVMGEDRSQRQAVFAIPEWFEQEQESALAMAAHNAGIGVLRFIEDAAAMALALAFDDPRERAIAIVHVSAGSVGVAFANIEPKSVFLLSSLSDRCFGGDDVLDALLDIVFEHEPLQLPVERALCRQAIDDMRDELAHGRAVTQQIQLPGGGSRTVAVDEAMLDRALSGLRAPLQDAYEDALEDAGIEADDLDVVYVTGALSAFPAVSDMILDLTEQLPRCEPVLQGLVARGAAVQASILSGIMEGPLVFDGKSTGSFEFPDRGGA